MSATMNLPASFLRIRLCHWTSIGMKLPSGGLSKRWRFYHCTACSTTRKANAEPTCPLDGDRRALAAETGGRTDGE